MAIRRRVVLQALGVGLLLIVFALVNALFRIRVLEPNLGPEPARILAATTLAGAIFVAALFFLGPGREASWPELLAIGGLWALLMAAFELGLVLARGELWRGDGDGPGPLFALGILSGLLSPSIVGAFRRLARRSEGG